MSELGGWIAARRGDLVSLLQQLIRARSENPPGDETAPAAVVRGQLQELGARVQEVEAAPGRVSVVGTFESDRPSASVLADAHLDTVPAGPGWSIDPFAAEVRDGSIYGRGAIDHKSPIAALLYAAAALKEHNRLPSRLQFVFDADEERGGVYGMRHLLRELTFAPDCVLYAVPTSFGEEGARFFFHGRDNVFIGSLGLARVHVSYETAVAYTVAPHEWWYAPEVGVGVAAELGTALPAPAWLGGRPRARLREAASESQLWEVAVLPGEEPGAVVKALRTSVERAVRAFAGARAELELTEAVAPASTPPDSPLVDALLDGAVAATGRRPHVGCLAAVTGMSIIQEDLKVPIAAFGYGEIERCHTVDERIAVDDLVATSVAYAEAIARVP